MIIFNVMGVKVAIKECNKQKPLNICCVVLFFNF